MTDKRRMTIAITVFVTADLTTNGDSTHVAVMSAEHNVMGSILPIGEVPETTEPWRARMALEGAKLALSYVQDKMNGAHEGKVPVLTQPGADA